MSPSVKGRVKWSRMIQLALRCLEMFISFGLLGLMILIKGIDPVEGWVMRVAVSWSTELAHESSEEHPANRPQPGVALFHTAYAIYHLSRRASGKTPGSTASYMLFASFLDITIIAFYAFSALAAKTNLHSWKTILSSQNIAPTLCVVVYYLAVVGASLFLVSLGISAYLTYTFRKITKLPPDCNPLEDNLTSRHKHKTSTVSMATMTSDRLSMPLESKRSSGAVYEELGRPPTLPFLHTRSNSSHNSFTTHKSSAAGARDSPLSYPERRYQINTHSPRSSISHQQKRDSFYGNSSSPTKRDFYSEVPLSDLSSPRSSRNMGNVGEGWYTSDSLTILHSRSSPKKNGAYQAIEIHDSQDEPSLEPTVISEWISDPGRSSLNPGPHAATNEDINPLAINPPTPRHELINISRDSPLSEISNNRNSSDIGDRARASSTYSRDTYEKPTSKHEEFKARFYGELKPGTPPLLVGKNRQVSSGNDYVDLNGARGFSRDVSGKVAEEGRGGLEGRGWSARFRKASGL